MFGSPDRERASETASSVHSGIVPDSPAPASQTPLSDNLQLPENPNPLESRQERGLRETEELLYAFHHFPEQELSQEPATDGEFDSNKHSFLTAVARLTKIAQAIEKLDTVNKDLNDIEANKNDSAIIYREKYYPRCNEVRNQLAENIAQALSTEGEALIPAIQLFDSLEDSDQNHPSVTTPFKALNTLLTNHIKFSGHIEYEALHSIHEEIKTRELSGTPIKGYRERLTTATSNIRSILENDRELDKLERLQLNIRTLVQLFKDITLYNHRVDAVSKLAEPLLEQTQSLLRDLVSDCQRIIGNETDRLKADTSTPSSEVIDDIERLSKSITSFQKSLASVPDDCQPISEEGQAESKSSSDDGSESVSSHTDTEKDGEGDDLFPETEAKAETGPLDLTKTALAELLVPHQANQELQNQANKIKNDLDKCKEELDRLAEGQTGRVISLISSILSYNNLESTARGIQSQLNKLARLSRELEELLIGVSSNAELIDGHKAELTVSIQEQQTTLSTIIDTALSFIYRETTALLESNTKTEHVSTSEGNINKAEILMRHIALIKNSPIDAKCSDTLLFLESTLKHFALVQKLMTQRQTENFPEGISSKLRAELREAPLLNQQLNDCESRLETKYGSEGEAEEAKHTEEQRNVIVLCSTINTTFNDIIKATWGQATNHVITLVRNLTNMPASQSQNSKIAKANDIQLQNATAKNIQASSTDECSALHYQIQQFLDIFTLIQHLQVVVVAGFSEKTMKPLLTPESGEATLLEQWEAQLESASTRLTTLTNETALNHDLKSCFTNYLSKLSQHKVALQTKANEQFSLYLAKIEEERKKQEQRAQKIAELRTAAVEATQTVAESAQNAVISASAVVTKKVAEINDRTTEIAQEETKSPQENDSANLNPLITAAELGTPDDDGYGNETPVPALEINDPDTSDVDTEDHVCTDEDSQFRQSEMAVTTDSDWRLPPASDELIAQVCEQAMEGMIQTVENEQKRFIAQNFQDLATYQKEIEEADQRREEQAEMTKEDKLALELREKEAALALRIRLRRKLKRRLAKIRKIEREQRVAEIAQMASEDDLALDLRQQDEVKNVLNEVVAQVAVRADLPARAEQEEKQASDDQPRSVSLCLPAGERGSLTQCALERHKRNSYAGAGTPRFSLFPDTRVHPAAGSDTATDDSSTNPGSPTAEEEPTGVANVPPSTETRDTNSTFGSGSFSLDSASSETNTAFWTRIAPSENSPFTHYLNKLGSMCSERAKAKKVAADKVATFLEQTMNIGYQSAEDETQKSACLLVTYKILSAICSNVTDIDAIRESLTLTNGVEDHPGMMLYGPFGSDARQTKITELCEQIILIKTKRREFMEGCHEAALNLPFYRRETRWNKKKVGGRTQELFKELYSAFIQEDEVKAALGDQEPEALPEKAPGCFGF